MAYDDIITNMFKEVAVALKLKYRETKVLRQNKFYELYNEKFKFSFSVIIDLRNGNVIIASRDIKLGTYKKDELMSNAKKELIVKIKKEIDKWEKIELSRLNIQKRVIDKKIKDLEKKGKL